MNPRLHQYLLTCATVVGAGMSHSAQAEVIYTPVHANFNLDYYLDLDHDGINDFHIHSYYLSGEGDLDVSPLVTGNRAVVESLSRRTWAAALVAGTVIGKQSPFLDPHTLFLANLNSFISYGPWDGLKNRYLGFMFKINGQQHFGWARISFNSFFCYGCIAGITSYAYETVPGRAILAGDTGNAASGPKDQTLGALALGAPGLDLWRKSDAR